MSPLRAGLHTVCWKEAPAAENLQERLKTWEEFKRGGEAAYRMACERFYWEGRGNRCRENGCHLSGAQL